MDTESEMKTLFTDCSRMKAEISDTLKLVKKWDCPASVIESLGQVFNSLESLTQQINLEYGKLFDGHHMTYEREFDDPLLN